MPDAPEIDDIQTRLQRSLSDSLVIERELGGGGMARVFLATERALDRRLVVKALDLEQSVAAGAERFRREIKVVAQLQHPHIVPVFAAGGDDTLLWYTMPYVSGESLRARITRDGALPLNDAVRITREVLDALGAAHARGIVHRDIKPENILLEGAHAQVADFGVAKALAEAGVGGSTLTTVGLALGTPAYMAPEQAMADPSTNHRADLYAVGAVLYEMLVGAPPFSGNAQSVVAAHLTAPVPQLGDRRRDVPPQIAGLVTRLLAKLPAERPQSAAEAMATLDSLTTPVTVAAPATTVAKRGTPLIAAVALGVVAIGAAAFWNVTRGAVPDFADGTEVIAVMPLGSTGDSAMTQLGRNLVVTLSANIDGVGEIRTVDPMSVLQRASALPQPLTLHAARGLASSLGATYFVHGTLVPEGNGVRVDAALHDVQRGDPLTKIRAQNLVTGLRELTDSLSSNLLRDIWRRSGTAPSPMLAEAATASGDALRAFLEGEAAFEQMNVRGALDAYDRATSFDSNFVQAWLRKAHLRSAAVLPTDSVTTRRLDALYDRMPARDQALRLTLPPEATFHERLRAQEAVAARFPEYHVAQYRAGDIFIHTAPLHGIPMTDAIPYLDRMDSLAPRHADNAQHRWMVAYALGDTAGMFKYAQRLDSLAKGANTWTGGFLLASEAYAKTGRFLDAATATKAMRAQSDAMNLLPVVAEVSLMLTPAFTMPAQIDSAFTTIANDLTLRPFQRHYVHALGTFQFSRGDVHAALNTFARLERMEVPPDVRATRIRSVAIAAWLGLLPAEEAQAAAAESQQALNGAPPAVQREVDWSHAVIAIVRQDSSRFQAALRSLPDTSSASRETIRGLRALMRERATGATDSLMAYDDLQAGRTPNFANLALSRLAIGRALTLAGDHKRAEQYLQWTDAIVTARRSVQIAKSVGPYNSYQRGLAAEAAGNRRAAIFHLRRFVDFVDTPPPALVDQVNDAKARLSRLMDRSG